MWPNPQYTVDSVTFNEEILNGIFCAVCNRRFIRSGNQL